MGWMGKLLMWGAASLGVDRLLEDTTGFSVTDSAKKALEGPQASSFDALQTQYLQDLRDGSLPFFDNSSKVLFSFVPGEDDKAFIMHEGKLCEVVTDRGLNPTFQIRNGDFVGEWADRWTSSDVFGSGTSEKPGERILYENTSIYLRDPDSGAIIQSKMAMGTYDKALNRVRNAKNEILTERLTEAGTDRDKHIAAYQALSPAEKQKYQNLPAELNPAVDDVLEVKGLYGVGQRQVLKPGQEGLEEAQKEYTYETTDIGLRNYVALQFVGEKTPLTQYELNQLGPTTLHLLKEKGGVKEIAVEKTVAGKMPLSDINAKEKAAEDARLAGAQQQQNNGQGQSGGGNRSNSGGGNAGPEEQGILQRFMGMMDGKGGLMGALAGFMFGMMGKGGSMSKGIGFALVFALIGLMIDGSNGVDKLMGKDDAPGIPPSQLPPPERVPNLNVPF